MTGLEKLHGFELERMNKLEEKMLAWHINVEATKLKTMTGSSKMVCLPWILTSHLTGIVGFYLIIRHSLFKIGRHLMTLYHERLESLYMYIRHNMISDSSNYSLLLF